MDLSKYNFIPNINYTTIKTKKMKKLMVALFFLMSISLGSFAQTPTTKGPTAPVAKTEKTAATTKPKAATTTVHAKKDGTPDRRFKENKNTSVKHIKKDGTPDRRYKENKEK